jgi:hypothetical protein
MKRLAIGFMAGLLAAAPAGAQNGSSTAPATSAPPPATATPPVTNNSAPAPTPAPEPAPAAPPVVIQQAPPPVQQAPVAISPDAAYPNGYQDPSDPFANEARAYNEQQKGFDWGLLGLLGLLGLIPLVRGNGAVRTIYVEREEPRRVVRERIEDDPPGA